MRDSIENISLLQNRINDLPLENRLLKDLLKRAGISYKQEMRRLYKADDIAAYDGDQGARIIHPAEITDDMANLFYSRFWAGRMSMLKDMKRKAPARPGIIRNAQISGQMSAPRS